MRPLLLCQVGFVRCDSCVKGSQGSRNSFSSDVRSKLSGPTTHRYTQQTGGATYPMPVLIIHFVRTSSKVGDPIVVSVAVDMVDYSIRKLAVDIQPSKPVRVVHLVVDAKLHVLFGL